MFSRTVILLRAETSVKDDRIILQPRLERDISVEGNVRSFEGEGYLGGWSIESRKDGTKDDGARFRERRRTHTRTHIHVYIHTPYVNVTIFTTYWLTDLLHRVCNRFRELIIFHVNYESCVRVCVCVYARVSVLNIYNAGSRNGHRRRRSILIGQIRRRPTRSSNSFSTTAIPSIYPWFPWYIDHKYPRAWENRPDTSFLPPTNNRMSAAEQLRHAPHTAVPGVTPAPPPYTQAMRMNSLNTLNGAGPQVSTMPANVCQIPRF